ncbi:hypothetical protein BJV78DRAFT_1225111 [Lactifluus subvellereus]|nr:hypothetical protein BJV78DRAFT_1225111 [Lactifluus subvellereus]
MHRLAVLALSLLVLCISAQALPSVLARETNADRLRRGYPPLPPTRRDTAKRTGPSMRPPQTSSGVIEVRDQSGTRRLGFVDTLPDPGTGIFRVSAPGTPQSRHLQATFSGSAHTLVATNAAFPPPFFLGSDFPFVTAPKDLFSGEIFFRNIVSSPGAEVWSFDDVTKELTVALPNPAGGTFPTVFWWQRKPVTPALTGNGLFFVTDVPKFAESDKITDPLIVVRSGPFLSI